MRLRCFERITGTQADHRYIVGEKDYEDKNDNDSDIGNGGGEDFLSV